MSNYDEYAREKCAKYNPDDRVRAAFSFEVGLLLRREVRAIFQQVKSFYTEVDFQCIEHKGWISSVFNIILIGKSSDVQKVVESLKRRTRHLEDNG